LLSPIRQKLLKNELLYFLSCELGFERPLGL